MSFILDALRKVDRSKNAEPRPEDLVVMEGGRQWGTTRRGIPLTVAILSVLALGLSAYALLRTLGPRAPAPSFLAGRSSPAAAPSAASAPLAEPERVAPRAKSAALTAPAPLTSSSSPLADSEESELETGPPVRLVGRSASPAEPSTEETPSTEPAPSDFRLPPLVLQGTAVVNDRPVAVVNYQRVFEGDIIEGARVVRISDRAVELEFQGRRFTIRF